MAPHYCYLALNIGKGQLKVGETCDIRRRSAELKDTKVVRAYVIYDVHAKAYAKAIEAMVQDKYRECLCEKMLDHFDVGRLADTLMRSKYFLKAIVDEVFNDIQVFARKLGADNNVGYLYLSL